MVADDFPLFFFFFFKYFSEIMRINISSELFSNSHDICQALFSLKTKIQQKTIKMSSAAVVIGALRVKTVMTRCMQLCN